MKKRELTEAEVFYVEEKSKDGMTADELSTILNLSIDSIVPHLHKKEHKETLTSKSFGRHPRGGIVVGTESAAHHGDSKPVGPNRDVSKFITNTKGE